MISYFFGAIACWVRHAGHSYGTWEYDMGPNGYRIYFRTCQRCGWIQTPTRAFEG